MRIAERLGLIAVMATVCGGTTFAQAPGGDAKKPVVMTTFYPTAYFAERIAGDAVTVVNPCPPDEDPAFWRPDTKVLREYQAADLILVNGADFEKWVEKASLPKSKIVDTTKAFKDEFIIIKDAVKHSHGPGREHTHDGIDGHTWLDPVNAKRQAEAIRDALAKLVPARKPDFDKNFAALATDLDALDARFKAISEQIKDQQLLGNHPAWNYVARRYGWKLESFAVDPAELPTDEALGKIRAFIEKNPAQYMLWEDQPDKAVEEKIVSTLKLQTVVFRPAETLSEQDAARGENYLTIMRANLDRLGAMIRR